jgi:TolB-like protein/DNA-binding SARP family transcriptional activator
MIEFRLLGSLCLIDAAGREVKSLLTRPRRLALLAYLAAATPRGFHRRDTLLALFWPELDQEHARAALRQALHILRSALGADVVVTRGDEEIGLDVARVWCDVVAFDEAIVAGQFEGALELYHGNLLDGFFIPGAGEFERWQERERARLQEVAARAAQTLVTRYETGGDLPAAIEWARRAVRLGPHGEEPLRRLVTLLDRVGDRAGAVAAYDEFAKRLGADFETEPSAETKALLGAIRARETAAPVEIAGPAPTAAPTRRPGRTAWLTLTAAGLAVLLVALWPSPSPSPATGLIKSLAVLPLANLSGDSLQTSFADGMTEALVTDLGRLSSLRVSSRSAVLEYQRSGKALDALGVDAVVEGGVQSSGNRVRVDLRLIDAASGSQLWAGRIEDVLQHRFAIEDSMARIVAGALHVPLTLAEERALRTAPTGNAEAYDLYLRGKIRVRRGTREDDSVAIGFLERAVALDPSFAAAQAQLAQAYGLRVGQFAREDTLALDKAYFAVEKALQLNPDLADAHWARGYLLWGVTREFPHERAIQEDRRALALNPNLAEAHHHLGVIYLHIGLIDSAVAQFRQAMALNPFDANAQRRIGIALVYRGKYEEGLAEMRQAGPESNPALWTYQVAWALLYLGRNDEASALMEEYLRAHPEDRGGVVRSTRAILRAKAGDARGAEEDIREAVEAGKGFIHFHHSAYNIASAYAILRQPGPALRWLREAAETGWPCYPYFAHDPNLVNIRSDPGFRTFMRGLKAEWDQYRAMR